MENVELIVRKLLASPAFASVLAILAFYYSWYLFQKTKRRENFCVLTMTTQKMDVVRDTKFIVLNNLRNAVERHDFASKDNLRINISPEIEIRKIELLSIPNYSNDVQLNFNRISKQIEIDFEFLRSEEGIYFKIFHNSKRDGDSAWRDFKIHGTFKHKNIYKRDFSDQMVYSASRASNYSYILSVVYTFVLTVFVRIILADIGIAFSNEVMIISGIIFLICSYFIIDRVLSKVGNLEYTKMWKLINDYEKSNKMPKIIYDSTVVNESIGFKKIKKHKKSKHK